MGSVGATQSNHRSFLGLATLLGFMSGLAPDLDVFIRSATDPLLMLEYHRQFTHSLLFIPMGSFICAAVFHLAFARKKLKFYQSYIFCALGYATHALIDACTTYGTLLFWPFSDERIAWNIISIIDPLFTLPILFLVLANLKFRKRSLALLPLLWTFTYLSMGLLQRERAEAAAWQLAEQRGLTVAALEAKPSFANLIVWKIIVSTETHYFVDAVKVGLAEPVFFEGESVVRLDLDRDFPNLDKDSQQMRDIERFSWFSMGYLAVSPTQPDLIIDMRYSMLPNQIKGLWGIRVSPDAGKYQHVEYIETTDRDGENFAKLWQMITAKSDI